MNGNVFRRMMVATAVVLALALVAGASAFAAEVSREEFKAQAEPICKKSTLANEQILGNVQKEVKQGKLKTAAAKFTKASKAQSQALHELEALPQPAADEARLGKWFSYLKTEAEMFTRAGKKLKAGDKAGAEHIITQLTQIANKANLEVLPFGFRYCRQEPSKFT